MKISKNNAKKSPTIAELYPDGYHVSWHEQAHCDWDKQKLADTLPLDIFYKLYPLTATWLLRQKHHSNPEEEAESS